MAEALAIIPARVGSTRFPGKVLADETGYPLLWHVCQQAQQAELIEQVIVATDDERVREVMSGLGVRTIMTDCSHANGTSRLAQACEIIGLPDDAIIVNVQGDEPEIEPGIIDLVVETLSESECEIGTVGSPFADDEDPTNPNIVKVVTDSQGYALYFSRALIPHDREASGNVERLKHVGLYAYRKSFLVRYAAMSPTPLEQAEQLEQLRVLEHGHRIVVARGSTSHHGIDTPEQYRAFVDRWRAAHPG